MLLDSLLPKSEALVSEQAFQANSGVPTTPAPLDTMADVKRNAGKTGAAQVPESIDSLVAAIGARYATTPSAAPVHSDQRD